MLPLLMFARWALPAHPAAPTCFVRAFGRSRAALVARSSPVRYLCGAGAAATRPPAQLPGCPSAPASSAAHSSWQSRSLHLSLRTQEKPHKRSIEELAGQQLSGADPGGELGALDPGPKSLGTEGGQGGLGTWVLHWLCWQES